ncbi:fatty acid desaturase family protein, partial [Escherichia coli]|uniref:fatty acid desaturase family protein n=1 Tax=Escherichia coli TaxID=562 RepID=UPI000CC04C53
SLSGRALLFLGVLPPAWLAGTALLAVSKILENMEIGHNVMHAQWDWLNDPALDSRTYEWDNTCPAAQWKHSHNYMHHTYTNVVGKDRDVGYGIMRLSGQQRWHPVYLLQPLYNWVLAALFQWGVALHDLEFE